MNKCLIITIAADFPDDFLRGFVQNHAKDFGLEGTAQVLELGKKLRIIVCGAKEKVDLFVDTIDKGSSKCTIDDLEIEPFLKDKDYRGVFRVIE